MSVKTVKRLSKRDRAVHLVGEIVMRVLTTPPGPSTLDHDIHDLHNAISRAATRRERKTICTALGYDFEPPEFVLSVKLSKDAETQDMALKGLAHILCAAFAQPPLPEGEPGA